MRKESRRARACLSVLLLATALVSEYAEGGSGSIALENALPVEAPTSLFSAKLGKGPDDDAELLVSGSWSATVLASLDLQAQPGGSLRLASAQPLLFTQSPDLSLSFLLFKKLFVEARVANDVTQASYAAGYRGGKDELLKELRVGNSGISFPSLPFLAFGEGSYRSFGAAALIQSEGFTGRAMVRYDQADRVVKRFVGSTEVTETEILPNAFISGQYFLTRSPPGPNLAVFVKSVSGSYADSVSGDRYRKLDATEFSYSAITGLVSLSFIATTKVIAGYAASLGDVVLSTGLSCDLLYNGPPTAPSTGAPLVPALQALNRYASTASAATAEAFVKNVASGQRDSYYSARIDPAGFVEVIKTGLDSPTMDPASYRQPFSGFPAGMDWIYSTDFSSDIKQGEAPVYTRSIVVRSFSSSDVITIDKDIVAGSVEVTRDGLPDYSFIVDSDKGILTLVPPPGPTNEIVVSYMKESTERKSGNLAGALGGFWSLDEGWDAWAALGASWALPGTSYTSGDTSNPGSINLTAGEKETKGPFVHSAAIAGRYSKDDATGLYRVEGMESTSDYASSFRSISASGYIITETAEQELTQKFPKLVSSFHADGSVQKALQIAAGTAPAASAQVYKVESAPPYASFTTFSFFAKLPGTAALDLTLDDGASTKSIEAPVGVGSGNGSWRRYILHYGNGDSKLYVQDSEGSSETFLGDIATSSPTAASVGSRLVITVTGLAASESAWVDEILLEDSVGRTALLFQGQLGYSDPHFALLPGNFPLLSGLDIAGDAQAALDSSPFVSGGGELASTLVFAKIGFKARAVATSASGSSFSGGHSIELPSSDFPLKVKDEFELDPVTGAFGRKDTLLLQAKPVAGLAVEQSSAWTPAASLLDKGLLLQTWDGSLTLGPSIAVLGLKGQNRSRPALSPQAFSGGYIPSWIDAFQYALPALESDSEARDAEATLDIKGEGGRSYLSASIGESAEPEAAGGGIRRDLASIRISLPIELASLSIDPYYSRSWKDKRLATSGGMLGDAEASLSDFSSLPVLYRSLPFVELGSAGAFEDFSAQSAPGGLSLPEASLAPETGISLSREYGSNWYDLALPSALAFSYQRLMSRTLDQATDAGLWSTTAKFAAVNLFGSLGSYPLGLPFDSDEFLSTVQATLQTPRDGGATSLDVQYQGLFSLYAGQADKLDVESRLALSQIPDKLDWTASLLLSLSFRSMRHWLSDLYTLAAGAAAPRPSAPGEVRSASIASLFLEDLATRTPNVRTTLSLKGGLSGLQGDAIDLALGWSFAESYEAKLTVPERLTLKLDLSSNQSLDRSTRVLDLGLELGLGAVISF